MFAVEVSKLEKRFGRRRRSVAALSDVSFTLGKGGTIHHRRLAVSRLHQEDAVKILFNEIAPAQKERRGGYTRIIRLHQRQGDASQSAILEWVDMPEVTEEPAEAKPAEETKPAEAKAEAGKAKAEAAK